MNPKLFRWLKRAVYPVVALFAFLFFFYATFPYDKVKEIVEAHAAASGNMSVRIGDLGPSLFTGLSASDVVVRIFGNEALSPSAESSNEPKSSERADQRTVLERFVIDEVTVSVGLFSAIFGGTLDVDFEVEGFGGELEGNYANRGRKGSEFSVVASELDVGRLPRLSSTVGVPFGGKLSVKAQLDLPRNRLSQANGNFELSCEECSMGDGKAKLVIPGNAFLKQGITLPKVRLGQMTAKAEVKKGVAKLENVSSRSGDFESEVDGSINLRTPIGYSTIQVQLRFRIGNELKERAKNVPFDLLEGTLDRGKQADGFYAMSLSGLLRRPRTKLGATMAKR